MNHPRPIDTFIEHANNVLQKDFLVIGKERVPSFVAWTIITFFVGITVSIAFLASRSGTLEGAYGFGINDLIITTKSLHQGKVGIQYHGVISASGGSDFYTWQITNGSLPNGLMLRLGACVANPCKSSAVISGVPKKAGTYKFTVKVNSGEKSATKRFQIVVASVYFQYSMDKKPAQTFVVNMTSLDDIKKARDDLKKVNYFLIVSGIVKQGDGGFNSPWSWHLDPATIELGESFIEVCDANPLAVEQHLPEWLGKLYCPWDALITKEIL